MAIVWTTTAGSLGTIEERVAYTKTLTAIGAHQDLIVKRVEPTQIHLQSKSGIPINAFFHVFGARADGEALTPEYEGQSPEDYPGKNDQYSIAGYHYDRRTL